MIFRIMHKLGQAQERKNKKKISKLKLSILLVTGVGLFILGTRYHDLSKDKKSIQESVVIGENISGNISIEEIESEIENIGELASIEYSYTDAGKFSDAHQIKDFTIPLTTKSFVVRWDGIIKAGIDLSKVNVEVDDSSKTIIIHLPKAEILSHTIDNDSLEILDETKNIFNPISVEDVTSFIGESKTYMEDKAVKKGLLDNATNNVKSIIEKQLNLDNNIKSNYTIKFEETEE